MTTVAITGAGRGIGLELTRQYAAAGDRVIALVRHPDGAQALRSLADESDGRVRIVTMDVGDDASVRAAADGLGAETIDILFNVAGVVGPVPPELERSDWAVWDDVLNVLLKGPLRVLQAFLPHLAAGGKVMNLTSQIAASTWPMGMLYPYSAAKAGLNRLMRSVAFDLRDRGIIVGLIHPGYVRTEMGGAGADIEPEESARGIRAVAAGWTIERTGDFYKWNGEPHPW